MVIELDAPVAAVASRPPRRSVPAGVTLILLALLTAAAPLPRAAGPVVVPARPGDTMVVDGDRLHVIEGVPAQAATELHERVVRTYALPRGRLLARTTVVVTASVFGIVAAGGLLLVSYQADTLGSDATVAVALGTRRTRWQVPARVLAVSADVALVREYRSFAGGRLWSGIELATGRRVWAVRQPVTGNIGTGALVDGFPSRLVTATARGELTVRDTTTGAVLAATTVAAPASWSRRGLTVWPVGDLVLVGGLGGLTAYGLSDLAPRWSSPADLNGRRVPPDCAGQLCLVGYQGGIQVLDPATGAARWSSGGSSVGPAGTSLLVGDAAGLRAADPRTGVSRAVFPGWQQAGDPRPDGRVVAVHQPVGSDSARYALLDPDSGAIRLLGTADRVSGDCHAGAGALVCRRLDGSVGSWPLTELLSGL
ncbi:hypothetical protein [Actinoplanes sp. RD1]|uniref:hypothetical protein n=1 Tax=Actinoplanes sp. RD1 TaxID=3064538 RepID=UPI0027427069|nr:hypothetical protein [Actinoplanes sp. RD1]